MLLTPKQVIWWPIFDRLDQFLPWWVSRWLVASHNYCLEFWMSRKCTEFSCRVSSDLDELVVWPMSPGVVGWPSASLHYRLRSIRGGQFRLVNFASHFIRVQIFQIDFLLILSASKYFRYISLSFYICRRQNEHSINSVKKIGRVELCQIFHPSNCFFLSPISPWR